MVFIEHEIATATEHDIIIISPCGHFPSTSIGLVSVLHEMHFIHKGRGHKVWSSHGREWQFMRK